MQGKQTLISCSFAFSSSPKHVYFHLTNNDHGIKRSLSLVNINFRVKNKKRKLDWVA